MFNTVLRLLFYSFFGLTIIAGCSVKKFAVNSVADALTEEGTSVFATDDDPQLVAEALPFALKTMESLLLSVPENRKLLIGTAAGFVQYSHAFVLMPAERLEKADRAKSRDEKVRAKKLFLRARNYGLDALNLKYTDFKDSLIFRPEMVLDMTSKEDVPALYWTAVAWISAISVDKGDMKLVADLPVVIQMLERCLVLDESWGKGAIHEVFIPIDAGRTEAEGGGIESAKKHFERAMEINGGKSIGVKVSYAESICIPLQDRENFERLLREVLTFDVDRYIDYRLVNILAQQKAEFLLEHVEDYFI